MSTKSKQFWRNFKNCSYKLSRNLASIAIAIATNTKASKQAYLFVNKNDRLPKKPLAQQCWQPIVSTTVKKNQLTPKKIYIYPGHTT